MIQLAIDGKVIESNGDETILDAATCAGIYIPTLCFDAGVDPIGSCRLCCVEVEGEIHPQIACRTPVHDGMQIATCSPAIEEFVIRFCNGQLKRSRLPAVPMSPTRNFIACSAPIMCNQRANAGAASASIFRIPTFAWTCPNALIACFVCIFATMSRGSLFGTFWIAAAICILYRTPARR